MQNNKPKVSIIVPVYNAEKTIERCINALITQSYNNIEIVCVNDGSSDNSFAILEKFRNKDSRIKIYTQENSGPAYTRHFAISQATGKYLMFCDADDWYENNMVECMVTTIEQENTDMVMCDCNIIDLADNTIQNAKLNKYNHILLLGKHSLNINNVSKVNGILWNKILKREILEKYNIRYPKKYEHDDLIFIYKYLAQAKTYFGLKEKLYNYIVGNQTSLMGKLYTRTNNGKEFDFIYAFLDLFDYLADCKDTEYILYIKHCFIGNFSHFIEFLPSNKAEKAFRELKEIVNTLDFFKKNNPRIIRILNKYNSLKKYTNAVNSDDVNFLQQIFSIKNEGRFKIIRILGIKIKFGRKNYIPNIPQESNIKILIAYHKKTPLLKNDICIPIHCGRKIAFEKSKDGIISKKDYKWMCENMIGDDTGDNISHLNRKFSELTALYWAWKNYDKLGNPDYIGLMHYRTIFNLTTYPSYDCNYLDSLGYKHEILYPELVKYKFLSNYFVSYEQNSYFHYKEKMTHYGADILFYDTFLDILKEKYPEDYRDICNWNLQKIAGPYKNMFITSREEFFKYCEWIFPKLLELDSRMKDYPYQKHKGSLRSIAWLSEMLTAFYFWRLSKNVEYKELSCFKPIIE